MCDLAVLPLGCPLCAVCLPICGAVQSGWEWGSCALSLLGNSCACLGAAVCSQTLTRQVWVVEGGRRRGGMVCSKENS